MKILRNRLQCLHCDTIIESRDASAEPVWCSCGAVGVSGGLEALKRHSSCTGDYKDLSKWEYDNPDYVEFM